MSLLLVLRVVCLKLVFVSCFLGETIRAVSPVADVPSPLMSVNGSKQALKKGLDSCFKLTTWNKQKESNARVFDANFRKVDDEVSMLSCIREEAQLWQNAGANKIRKALVRFCLKTKLFTPRATYLLLLILFQTKNLAPITFLP